MAVGLYLRVSNGQTSFERAFMRPPVTIGRDPRAAHCAIDDRQVSKLHACIDIQDGTLCVRDVGSTNGTYVGGRRLAPNVWVRPGAVGEPVEVVIGDYTIRASVHQDAATDTLGSASLAELADEIPSYRSATDPHESGRAAPAPPVPPERASVPSPQAAAAVGTFAMRGPVVRLAPKYASALAGMTAFYDAIVQELEAVPPATRPHVCQELVNAYANLADDPRARAVLQRYGWRASSAAQPAVTTSLSGAALVAMQELAGWYVGRNRTLTTPAEVASFKDKLRATLDEFLLGYPALLESMNRFEQQMAIQAESGAALPSAPAQLAAKLLDWTVNSDALRQRLRASFAELMMHQVALLNGVMSGVKALLTELSPAQIEKAAVGNRQGLFSRTDPWTVYKRRHSDLADEENERFRLLFGPEFVEEYRQFTREAPGMEKTGPRPTTR